MLCFQDFSVLNLGLENGSLSKFPWFLQADAGVYFAFSYAILLVKLTKHCQREKHTHRSEVIQVWLTEYWLFYICHLSAMKADLKLENGTWKNMGLKL